MSEVSYSPEESRFTPENNYYLIPLDPYNDRMIQFIALKQLGYPVELQVIPANQLPTDSGYSDTDDWGSWHRSQFQKFVRPIVNDPEFEKFIMDPDCPGDIVYTDERFDRIWQHPSLLASRVDYDSAHMNAFYLFQMIKNPDREKNSYSDSSEGEALVTTELLERCFIASYERYMWKLRSGYPLSEFDIPKAEDTILYGSLVQKGKRPINPEDLGGLMIDLYRLVEKIVPEFLEFKSTSKF